MIVLLINISGAFFIPYLIMLTFCGIPLVFMEMGFGQYASLGPVTIWRAVPLFKGISFLMTMDAFYISVFYIVLIINWLSANFKQCLILWKHFYVRFRDFFSHYINLLFSILHSRQDILQCLSGNVFIYFSQFRIRLICGNT